MKTSVPFLMTFLLLLWGPDDALRASCHPAGQQHFVSHQEVFPVAVRNRFQVFSQLTLPLPRLAPPSPAPEDGTPAPVAAVQEQAGALEPLDRLYLLTSLQR